MFPVIVWLDVGNDLGTSRKTSWMQSPLKSEHWKVQHLPIIQDGQGRRKVLANQTSDIARVSTERPGIRQSAACLPFGFVENLDSDITAADSFYAVSGIFALAAASENQILNLVERKISKEVDPLTMSLNSDLNLSNLLYNKQVLERHIEYLRENLDTLNERAVRTWPKSSNAESDVDIEEHRQQVARTLRRDFTHLIDKAQSLLSSCETAMQIVTQEMSVRESAEQILEAKNVTRLTQLAFYFIPLSFIASIYGMNFKQLGQGNLSIWVFFVTAIPMIIISALVLNFNRMVGNIRTRSNRSSRKTLLDRIVQ